MYRRSYGPWGLILLLIGLVIVLPYFLSTLEAAIPALIILVSLFAVSIGLFAYLRYMRRH